MSHVATYLLFRPLRELFANRLLQRGGQTERECGPSRGQLQEAAIQPQVALLQLLLITAERTVLNAPEKATQEMVLVSNAVTRHIGLFLFFFCDAKSVVFLYHLG